MDATRKPEELPLKELEALLFQRRRRLAERQVRRFAIAENVLHRRAVDVPPDPSLPPPRSPESWRGEAGGDRYFRPLVLMPLGNGAGWAPPALASAPAVSPTATARHLLVGVEASQEMPSPARRQRRGMLLLAVEVAALIAFLVILANSYFQLQALNRQASAMQRQALAQQGELVGQDAALLLPTAVQLLPGGRPTPGAAAAPAGLRGLIKVPVSLAVPPTPGPNAPRRLVIPKLGVDAPVVPGDSWEDLKKGIGHRPGTANPGERGNMVVSAHNDIYGEIFRDLLKLEPGDEVRVYTDEGAYRYIVNSVEIVLPTKVEVMDPTDYPVLTMITCYPYLLDTHRVVVAADLAE